jgi:hypothetical protein
MTVAVENARRVRGSSSGRAREAIERWSRGG